MYTPAALMEPPPLSTTRQVTAVLFVPVTVAVKVWVAPACTWGLVGETETAMGVPLPRADTNTVARALLLVFATLVATTW
ncbi:hypothetical protein [Archangium sp.]|uniref:hypothetical protein n=1 Tax=Archangium sp. TaxID=1872627 RepID=UPI00286C54FF|nr:hypothetical protein [Archangium sp.]